MPRNLLIVDEFQEFFVEDDKISQDAALLLDRLVRQGRAFGIHVLLGSQTLAGAYSLARSTIGQMAVRIALQCSETDAHLILSEDNSAARLLSRPGEAIYNDANGMIEGNHPFQVVWLDEDVRERLSAAESATRRTGTGMWRGNARPFERLSRLPLLVFEGNIPADPTTNRRLQRVLAKGRMGLAVRPRLGIALGFRLVLLAGRLGLTGRTAGMSFGLRDGGNILIVGRDDAAALGVMSALRIGSVWASGQGE